MLHQFSSEIQGAVEMLSFMGLTWEVCETGWLSDADNHTHIYAGILKMKYYSKLKKSGITNTINTIKHHSSKTILELRSEIKTYTENAMTQYMNMHTIEECLKGTVNTLTATNR